MARVYIFRHGQTFDNKNHIFSGWRETDLTPQGIEEAKKIGETLKGEKVVRAFQSDQVRSKHTLELVLDEYHPQAEVITDPRIKERNYGDLTGLNKDEIEKKDPKDYELWHRSYDTAPPNGESIKDVETRVLLFLDDLKNTSKETDVFFISAHGNSLRPMRRYFEGISIEEMCSFEHEPGKIYSYEL